MDRMLKSHDFEIYYDATVVHKHDTPELADGKATDCTLHALGFALASRTQEQATPARSSYAMYEMIESATCYDGGQL
ncbi:hypothetical protein HD806DRAFT_532301 [Xylariaceae sp. AK1471]|nr:hypothetical protein HD806DRAFT_532301 [Xylariaceae sp. AK1471]